MAVDAGKLLLPYREDHIGVTRWPLLIAIGLTILTVALAVPAVATWVQPIGALTVTAFIFSAAAAGVAWVLVYTGWVLGIQIDPQQIRFGALRRAEARARRGKGPPANPRPYATWLYEYRCPTAAIRRIWIVSGGRDALDPERATGVRTFLGSRNGRRISREGWIRMPFSAGGLMFQIDGSQASLPGFGGHTWRGFDRIRTSSLLGESDIWFTPVANPDLVHAALVEALRLNGLQVDAQGNVRANSGG